MLLPKVSQELSDAVFERIYREAKSKDFNLKKFIDLNAQKIEDNPHIMDGLFRLMVSNPSEEHIVATMMAGFFVYRALKDQLEINELDKFNI